VRASCWHWIARTQGNCAERLAEDKVCLTGGVGVDALGASKINVFLPELHIQNAALVGDGDRVHIQYFHPFTLGRPHADFTNALAHAAPVAVVGTQRDGLNRSDFGLCFVNTADGEGILTIFDVHDQPDARVEWAGRLDGTDG
jgi:hypothetical protein